MLSGSAARRTARRAPRPPRLTLIAVSVAAAVVAVTLAGWQTPAQAAGPEAVDDAVTAVEDVPTTGNVLTNDSGEEIRAELTIAPVNGTVVLNADGSFTYTPNANYHGTDTFTYRARDESGAFDLATVTITIQPVDDAPTAAPDSYTTPQDTELVVPAPGVLGNDSDVDSSDLVVALRVPPAHGTLVLNANGSLRYTPSAGYAGTDSFTYATFDPEDLFDEATVSITITPAAPTNHAPVAQDGRTGTEQDTATTFDVDGLASDEDGDDLTYTKQADPQHGTVALSGTVFTYTPEAGFVGTDSFDYRATDPEGAFDTGTVTVVVSADTSPVAMPDSFVAVEGEVLSVDAPGVLANDTDPNDPTDALTAAVAGEPEHGALTLDPDGGFTYTPEPGYVGSDSFSYTANDPPVVVRGAPHARALARASAPATVTLSVTAASDPAPTDPAAPTGHTPDGTGPAPTDDPGVISSALPDTGAPAGMAGLLPLALALIAAGVVLARPRSVRVRAPKCEGSSSDV